MRVEYGVDVARTIGRLNPLAVSRAKRPGLHSDGGGLYLQITKAGVRSWLFRFMLNRRARAMGLGALASVSLAGARSRIKPLALNRACRAPRCLHRIGVGLTGNVVE